MIALADAMCWMNEAVCFSDEELELAARHAEADMARMAVTLEMTTA
jgi:hypothetical protein